MKAPGSDLTWVVSGLDRLERLARGHHDWHDHLARIRSQLSEATVVDVLGQRRIVRGSLTLGLIRPYGSVALYLATDPPPPRHRLAELDRGGQLTMAVLRGRHGEFREGWIRSADGELVGLLAGGATHPAWGASDRLVRARHHLDAEPEPLTVSAALDWDAIGAIPPLAEPRRLPPGAGTSILNLLAALAMDQETGPLRYRGPYPTEQLFWALAESFRFDPAHAAPAATFTDGGEVTLTSGELREVPLDWTPAPHERLWVAEGISVQLRDGVEKVWSGGRSYYRTDWQTVRRREHRVVRAVRGPDGDERFIASLEALGTPLEDHLIFDAHGNLLERLSPEPVDDGADTPLDSPWRDVVGALLPLEATPLLGPAIDAVWPALGVVWGPVADDLIEVRGRTVRLSRALVRAFAAKRARCAPAARRMLAQALVREVLGLLGPPVRHAAGAWLEAEPPTRQHALLEAARHTNRQHAIARAARLLARLLDGLEAGEALPG